MDTVYKVDSLTFISIWDLDGSDAIREFDLSITYGDGITLHSVADVVDEIRTHPAPHLLAQLQKIRELFGENFLILF
jgi:hypothetical protein